MKRILLAISLLILWLAPAQALTLSDVRTQVRIAVRDNPSDSSRRRYSDTVLLDYINEAQREVSNATWLCLKSTTYVLSPMTTYYTLPTDLLAIDQVYFTNRSGNLRELEEKSQRGLYDSNPAWSTSRGEPIEYWVSATTNPSPGASAPLYISYVPIPTSASTGTIVMWYLNQPADLSADSDVPFENRRHLYPYHMCLAYHVITKIKILEGWGEEAITYQTLYVNSVNLMKENLGKAPNYTPGMRTGSTSR